MIRRAWKAAFFIFLGVFSSNLTSCGDSNGSGSQSSAGAYSITGKVIKAAVNNASITIYTLDAQRHRDSVIGQGTTGSDGSFSVNGAGVGGPLALVVASGGEYTDEATGQKVSIPSWWENMAVIAWPSGYSNLIITPLTRMASEQTLSRMASGESALTALANAKTNVADYFGLAGVDISAVAPVDLTVAPGSALDETSGEFKYGLALAALSQTVANKGMAPSKTLDLIQNMVDDLVDGRFDNVGSNGGALPNTLTLTPGQTISGLSEAGDDFLAGPRNASGVTSSASTVTTPQTPSSTTPPSAPGGVSVTAGDGSLTVSWSAVSGASSYNLYRSTSSGTGTGGTLISGAGSPYTDTGLANGTTYYYVVTAVNSAGESSSSAEVSGTPAPSTTPPSAPGGVSVTAGDGSLTVSWSAVSGASSYNLYRSTSSGTGTGGTRVSGAGSPYTDTGLANGTTYYYVVTAVNSAGESSSSAEVSGTPAPIPSAPSDFALSPGNGSVTTSWTASSGATSYYVYYSTDYYTVLSGTQVACAASPCVVSGLTNGVWYYFVATAANSSGESGPSTEWYARPSEIYGLSFTDPNLASCVTGAGALSISELGSLDCSNKSITDLTGIEALTGLTLLKLSDNQIADVTPIASLTAMQQLNLANNAITAGVGSLATSLNQLWWFSLSGNSGVYCVDLQNLIDMVQANPNPLGSITTNPSSAQDGVNCSCNGVTGQAPACP